MGFTFFRKNFDFVISAFSLSTTSHLLYVLQALFIYFTRELSVGDRHGGGVCLESSALEG